MYWLYNIEHNIAYHPIPKCASSSIIKWLCHDKTINNYNGLSALSNYYTFTIVRNPYTRVISSYSQLLLMTETEPDLVAGMPLDTFEDFIYFLSEQGTLINNHTHTQASFLKLPRHHVDDFGHIDYIGKLEKLEESMCHVAKQCNVKNYTLPKLNKSILKTVPMHTAETKKITYELYKIDFDMFDYDK